MQHDLLVSSTLINRQDQMLYNPRWCKSNHGSGKIKSIGMIMYSPHYKSIRGHFHTGKYGGDMGISPSAYDCSKVFVIL